MNRKLLIACALALGISPVLAQTPPPDSLTALQQRAQAQGYQLYMDGVSFFIQTALQQDLGQQKPLIRYNPKLDNAFVLVQLVSKKYALYQHQWVRLDLPLIRDMNAQLANVFVLIPLEKGRQYITGEPLIRALGGAKYLAYKGIHPLQSVTGVHVSAMVFKPERL